uniref:Leucine-rich repeat-containing N-terminal plant-type domain-containing protein n=1 Tax=Fagus sylvatica TaxID=28930 RepID=A0A2N9FD79_FAGSY
METSLRLRVITIILFLQFLTLPTLHTNFCTGESTAEVRCIESERVALLRFKQDLQDPSHRLASWATGDGDCCQWVGVVCHNVTGHVRELFLRSFPLVYDDVFMSGDELRTQMKAYWSSRFGGKINPSLLDLKHLIYLDLSYNNFYGTQIPKFLGSMERLRYLNLSGAGFGGVIPHQLGNLSNLHYLNLGGYNNNLYVMNLQWLSGLPLLQHLDMSHVNLSQASDWLPDINKLPSLLELRLSNCYLSGSTPSTPSINFSSLATLDLSYNHFENTSNILWVFGLHNLVSLDLSGNQFQGPIPVDLQNMTSLRHLDLSYNAFNSSIPNWLYSFSRLEFLNLDSNSLQGTISSSIENLTSAISIDLSYNELGGKGKVRGVFHHSSTGKIIDLSKNNLSGEIPKEVTSLQGLQSLNLSFNSLNGRIPENIGDMGSLESIDFSVNQLSGQVPQTLSYRASTASSFVGNELCGPPLANNCTINYVKPNTENERSKDFGGLEVDWFYVSMALGFVVGFWVVWGPLLMNKHWRFLYFQFLDRLGNKLRGVVS